MWDGTNPVEEAGPFPLAAGVTRPGCLGLVITSFSALVPRTSICGCVPLQAEKAHASRCKRCDHHPGPSAPNTECKAVQLAHMTGTAINSNRKTTLTAQIVKNGNSLSHKISQSLRKKIKATRRKRKPNAHRMQTNKQQRIKH